MAQKNNIMSLWSRATKQRVTGEDIRHIKQALPGLGECQCERLNRELPFRSYMENKIAEQSSDRSDITYTSMGAGKLLFDWITLNKLIKHGAKKIIYVAIDQEYASLIKQLKTNRVHKNNLEHLFEHLKQTPYAQAIQSFFDWFVQIKNSPLPFDTFYMYVYDSFDGYFDACVPHQDMRSHIYVNIDNDTYIPDFEDNMFYNKFYTAWGKTIFQPQCRMYYLFHAEYDHNEYRHVLQAQIYSDWGNIAVSYKDEFGVHDITHIHTNLFIPDQVLPFIYQNKKIGIQINDTVFLHDDTRYKSITILSHMLEHPLQTISPQELAILIKETPELLTSQNQNIHT
jgi:hypothetical protein